MNKGILFCAFALSLSALSLSASANYQMPLSLDIQTNIVNSYLNVSELSCSEGQIPRVSSDGWICSDINLYTNSSFTDLNRAWVNTLGLGNLTKCTNEGDIPKISGGVWSCQSDSEGTGGNTSVQMLNVVNITQSFQFTARNASVALGLSCNDCVGMTELNEAVITLACGQVTGATSDLCTIVDTSNTTAEIRAAQLFNTTADVRNAMNATETYLFNSTGSASSLSVGCAGISGATSDLCILVDTDTANNSAEIRAVVLPIIGLGDDNITSLSWDKILGKGITIPRANISDFWTFNSTYDIWAYNQTTSAIDWILLQNYLTAYTESEPSFNANWTYLNSKANNTFNATYDAKPSNTFNSTYDLKPSNTFNSTYDTYTDTANTSEQIRAVVFPIYISWDNVTGKGIILDRSNLTSMGVNGLTSENITSFGVIIPFSNVTDKQIIGLTDANITSLSWSKIIANGITLPFTNITGAGITLDFTTNITNRGITLPFTNITGFAFDWANITDAKIYNLSYEWFDNRTIFLTFNATYDANIDTDTANTTEQIRAVVFPITVEWNNITGKGIMIPWENVTGRGITLDFVTNVTNKGITGLTGANITSLPAITGLGISNITQVYNSSYEWFDNATIFIDMDTANSTEQMRAAVNLTNALYAFNSSGVHCSGIGGATANLCTVSFIDTANSTSDIEGAINQSKYFNIQVRNATDLACNDCIGGTEIAALDFVTDIINRGVTGLDDSNITYLSWDKVWGKGITLPRENLTGMGITDFPRENMTGMGITLPFTNVTGFAFDWANLTAFNLDSAWTGRLGIGNITNIQGLNYTYSNSSWYVDFITQVYNKGVTLPWENVTGKGVIIPWENVTDKGIVLDFATNITNKGITIPRANITDFWTFNETYDANIDTDTANTTEQMRAALNATGLYQFNASAATNVSCGGITGAASNLCTLIDTDTANTTEQIQAAQTVNTTAEVRTAQLFNTTADVRNAQLVNTTAEVRAAVNTTNLLFNFNATGINCADIGGAASDLCTLVDTTGSGGNTSAEIRAVVFPITIEWSNVTGKGIILPWENITNKGISLPFTNITGFSFDWANISTYDLNVPWINELGMANITNVANCSAGQYVTGLNSGAWVCGIPTGTPTVTLPWENITNRGITIPWSNVTANGITLPWSNITANGITLDFVTNITNKGITGLTGANITSLPAISGLTMANITGVTNTSYDWFLNSTIFLMSNSSYDWFENITIFNTFNATYDSNIDTANTTQQIRNAIFPITLEWANITNYDLDEAWTGTLGWGNVSCTNCIDFATQVTGKGITLPWTNITANGITLPWENVTNKGITLPWSNITLNGITLDFTTNITNKGITGLTTDNITSVDFVADVINKGITIPWGNVTANGIILPWANITANGITLDFVTNITNKGITGLTSTNISAFGVTALPWANITCTNCVDFATQVTGKGIILDRANMTGMGVTGLTSTNITSFGVTGLAGGNITIAANWNIGAYNFTAQSLGIKTASAVNAYNITGNATCMMLIGPTSRLEIC